MTDSLGVYVAIEESESDCIFLTISASTEMNEGLWLNVNA